MAEVTEVVPNDVNGEASGSNDTTEKSTNE